MKPIITNREIAVYAVYLLGGIDKRIHTEDIAIKCFELAPESFSWIKYKDKIDKIVVVNSLMDASRPRYGELLRGRSGKGTRVLRIKEFGPAIDGWELTEAGINWINNNKEKMAKDLNIQYTSANRQEAYQKLRRFLEHSLFIEFKRNNTIINPSLVEIADLFRCSIDSPRTTWEKRFQNAVQLAQSVENSQVITFIKELKKITYKLLTDEFGD
ncbi:MAG: hypothetical protein FJY65_04690 [Calditrichaeota bacterium]|nr:hypothetical protein [Calditrichota bacterium]